MFIRLSQLITSLGLALMIGAQSLSPTAFAQAERASRARQASAAPVAEATVTLNEQFLNSFLDAMFTRLRGPQFPLSLTSVEPPPASPAPAVAADRQAAQSHGTSTRLSASPRAVAPAQCSSVIVLEREVGGVKTAVHFENGRVTAPLAFSGTYSIALLGCIRFQGWAETSINLEFNRARQVLSARVLIEDIHLSGIPGLASGLITGLVQNSLDQRINPVEILQAAQLSARIPIATSGGALRLLAKEVRPEVVPGALRLHIIYEFAKAD